MKAIRILSFFFIEINYRVFVMFPVSWKSVHLLFVLFLRVEIWKIKEFTDSHLVATPYLIMAHYSKFGFLTGNWKLYTDPSNKLFLLR